MPNQLLLNFTTFLCNFINLFAANFFYLRPQQITNQSKKGGINMGLDYAEFEKELERACNFTYKKFQEDFSNDSTYISAGGGRLEAFIEGIQEEFDKATVAFLKRHNAENDPEAKRHALSIAKESAKKCIEDISKIS